MTRNLDFRVADAPSLAPSDGLAGRRATTSHLQRLEAESIHIMREVAAEFRKPGDALFDRQGLAR